MQRFTVNDRVYLDFFFSVEYREEAIVNKEPEKCGALTWFPLDNLPDNTIPYIKTPFKLSF